MTTKANPCHHKLVALSQERVGILHCLSALLAEKSAKFQSSHESPHGPHQHVADGAPGPSPFRRHALAHDAHRHFQIQSDSDFVHSYYDIFVFLALAAKFGTQPESPKRGERSQAATLQA